MSLHNENKNVMEWKSSHKFPFYSFKNSYKPLSCLWIWYFNEQVTLDFSFWLLDIVSYI